MYSDWVEYGQSNISENGPDRRMHMRLQTNDESENIGCMEDDSEEKSLFGQTVMNPLLSAIYVPNIFQLMCSINASGLSMLLM